MTGQEPYRIEADGAVRLNVKVEPRSSRPGPAGFYGDAVKIRLSSPPVEGRANEELVKLLAEALDVRKADIEILSGQSSKRKTVRIQNADPARVHAWLHSTR